MYRTPRLLFFVSIIVFLGLNRFSAKSQALLEAGPLLGVSWYNGDLNPQRQFYRIHPAAGLIVRYSVNDRIAFRGSFLLAGISGVYPSGNQVIRELEAESYRFSRTLGDAGAMMEFNFFSFDHPFNEESTFTPYFTFGLGSVFYKRYAQENGHHTEKPLFVLSLPFGGGLKWKLKNGLRLGLEWTFRKSFADDLDLVGADIPVDPSDPYGFDQKVVTHNNDWVAVVGVSATFSLLNRRSRCNDGF